MQPFVVTTLDSEQGDAMIELGIDPEEFLDMAARWAAEHAGKSVDAKSRVWVEPHVREGDPVHGYWRDIEKSGGLFNWIKDGKGPVEKFLRRSLDAIGVDPYDVDLKKLGKHADEHEKDPVSRYFAKSPCYHVETIDFGVHILLPSMMGQKYPGLAKALRRTSPRWGRSTGWQEEFDRMVEKLRGKGAKARIWVKPHIRDGAHVAGYWRDIDMVAGFDTVEFARALGIDAHLVGGAVRDELLGRPHKDHDFLTPGHGTEELRGVLKRHGKVEDLVVDGRVVGLRLWPHYDGAPTDGVEFAPPRKEVSTGPGRQDFDIVADPDVSLEDDAQRRDFTINAIYKKLGEDGKDEIIDPLGGASDLKSRVLRTTTPNSFRDDPLRMLRGLRFMSQLGFGLHPDTEKQMRDHAASVEHVSGERIGGGIANSGGGELSKLLMGEHPRKALRAARDTGVLAHAFPELASAVGFEQESKYHDLTVDEHIFAVVQAATDADASLAVRLAALLHDSGKPESAWRGDDGRLHYYAVDNVTPGVPLPAGIENHPQEQTVIPPALDLGAGADVDRPGPRRAHEDIGAEKAKAAMTRLKYPNDIADRVVQVVQNHMFRDHAAKPTEVRARKFLARYGAGLALDLLDLKRADLRGKEGDPDEVSGDVAAELSQVDRFEQVVRGQMDSPYRVKDLAINGDDLIGIGVEPGPDMGVLLNHLLAQVIGTPSNNNAAWLLAEARRWLKKQKGVKGRVYVEPYVREGVEHVVGYWRNVVDAPDVPDVVADLDDLRDLRGVWDVDGPVLFWPEKIGQNDGEPLWKALLRPDGSELFFWFADDLGSPHHEAIEGAFTGWGDESIRAAGFGDTIELTEDYEGQAIHESFDIQALARSGDTVALRERYDLVAFDLDDWTHQDRVAMRLAALTASLRAVPRRHRRDIADARATLAGGKSVAAQLEDEFDLEEGTVESSPFYDGTALGGMKAAYAVLYPEHAEMLDDGFEPFHEFVAAESTAPGVKRRLWIPPLERWDGTQWEHVAGYWREGADLTTVADHLSIGEMKGKAKTAVEHAVAMVEKAHVWPQVHGGRETVPVTPTRGTTKLVSKIRRVDGAPVLLSQEIKVNTKASPSDAIHEIAHLLDTWLASPGVMYATEAPHAHADGGAAHSEWIAAVKQSSLFKRWLAHPDLPVRMKRYLAGVQEVFARSYERWVAEKTGDETLLRNIREGTEGTPEWDANLDPAYITVPQQWADEDFAPVGRALEAMLRAMGVVIE